VSGGSRSIRALLVLAPALVAVSAIFEFASVARIATERAATECALITAAVRRQLDQIAAASPGASLPTVAADAGLQLVLADALAQAPSVLHVAVCDTNRVAVAHSLPTRVGRAVERRPPLPRVENLGESFPQLWQLRPRGHFETSTPLTRDGLPYASIIVIVSGSFLWDSVEQSFWRGVVVSLVVLSVVIGIVIGLSRIVVGRVRTLEAGVAAFREGRFDDPIPESGADEFSRLARELNLLGEQFRRQQRGGRNQTTLHDLVDQTRVLMHLGQMAAGVAHEIRNPLQALTLELDALSQIAGSTPEIEPHVRAASQKVQRLDLAIRGFLRIARLRPRVVERIDLNQLLAEIRNELENDAILAGLELVVDPAPEPAEVDGDREVFRQAISNLVQNAIEALPSQDGRIVLRCRRGPGGTRLSVADTGPGIRPQDREKVLELFYTTREKGTGVGLAIVRQTAEMYGGRVQIEAGPAGGTVVTMALP
jgi:signal transduction histidine kinase